MWFALFLIHLTPKEKKKERLKVSQWGITKESHSSPSLSVAPPTRLVVLTWGDSLDALIFNWILTLFGVNSVTPEPSCMVPNTAGD